MDVTSKLRAHAVSWPPTMTFVGVKAPGETELLVPAPDTRVWVTAAWMGPAATEIDGTGVEPPAYEVETV